MRQKVLIIVLLPVFLVLSVPNNIYPISGSVKSQKDYIFTLDHIRNMRIIISNFATKDLKDDFDKTVVLFQSSSKEFYAQEFSYYDEKSKKQRTRFYQVKKELNALFDKMAGLYLKRAKVVLDSTSKESFDIIVTYGKQSNLVKFFNKNFDPRIDIKPYKEKEYHFFRDKEVIERYLKHGYKKLQDAKRIYNDQDLNFIKAKNEKKSSDYNYLISRFWKVISDCRQAKQYGIEIHKILKINEVTTILRRYHKNLVSLDPNPIFDDRIPEEFKVDANDNLKLIHSHEVQRVSKIIPKPDKSK